MDPLQFSHSIENTKKNQTIFDENEVRFYLLPKLQVAPASTILPHTTLPLSSIE
jgi:hypothetical protein